MKKSTYLLILIALNAFCLNITAFGIEKPSSKELAKNAISGQKAIVAVVKAPLKKDDAVKIAEAHLVKTYEKKVLEQKPWIVQEKPESFLIKGTWHKKPNTKGGVAEIEIAKKDGKILKCTHGK